MSRWRGDPENVPDPQGRWEQQREEREEQACIEREDVERCRLELDIRQRLDEAQDLLARLQSIVLYSDAILDPEIQKGVAGVLGNVQKLYESVIRKGWGEEPVE